MAPSNGQSKVTASTRTSRTTSRKIATKARRQDNRKDRNTIAGGANEQHEAVADRKRAWSTFTRFTKFKKRSWAGGAAKRTWRQQNGKKREITIGNTEEQYQSVAQIEETGSCFTYFAKLPPELRNMIWEETFPGPRIIRFLIDGKIVYFPGPSEFLKTRAEGASVPSTLQVNRESRGVARRHYTLTFETKLHRGPIYVDFRRDTMFFPTSSDLRYFCQGIMPPWEQKLPPWHVPNDPGAGENEVRFITLGHEVFEVTSEMLWMFPKLQILVARKIPDALETVAQGLVARIEERWQAEFIRMRASVATQRKTEYSTPRIEYLRKEEFASRYHQNHANSNGHRLRHYWYKYGNGLRAMLVDY